MALESKSKNCVVTEMVSKVALPKMVPVRQSFDKSYIPREEVAGIVRQEILNSPMRQRIKEKMRVAITCGSRGVINVDVVTKSIVDTVRELGADPFIFPAMGSHGGATAQGQLDLLAIQFGITEESMGCPILSSMEVVEVGKTPDGLAVCADKYAMEADAIILCNRIKAHTAFEGPYESGILKMAVVGVGKQHVAETIHEAGFPETAKLLPQFGKVMLENTKIIGGIATIENSYHQTCNVEVLDKDEIMDKEPDLLLEAKRRMGRILFGDLDVIVVDRIGKNISGDGMDPHVTGRYVDTKAIPREPLSQRLAILDITDESNGNAYGVGLADVTTKRLADKHNIDLAFPNAITATVLNTCKMPMFARSDKAAIQLALHSCNAIDKMNPRIVRISDTLNLEKILVSTVLLKEVEKHPQLEAIGPEEDWPFDSRGNLW